MSRLHPTYNMDLHVMDRQMNDKRINVPRCGIATRGALVNATKLYDEFFAYGYECIRTLLVFVDNKKDPDRLACVVFALDNRKTIVAKVDDKGSFVEKSLYDVNTIKRLPREFMYEIAGEKYSNPCNDPQYDVYGGTKVYARNRTCYAK